MAGGRLEEGVSLDGSASDELVPAMEEIVSEDSAVEEEESAWLETPLSHATKNRRKQQVRKDLRISASSCVNYTIIMG